MVWTEADIIIVYMIIYIYIYNIIHIYIYIYIYVMAYDDDVVGLIVLRFDSGRA